MSLVIVAVLVGGSGLPVASKRKLRGIFRTSLYLLLWEPTFRANMLHPFPFVSDLAIMIFGKSILPGLECLAKLDRSILSPN